MRIASIIPNILTISRIIVIPLIIACFYLDKVVWNKLAAALFLYATITDFLDGYLARLWSYHSNFGRMLDPIADKLLVGAIIVVLVDLKQIDVIPAIAIICREILVSGLREFLAQIKVSIPVSNLAKIKTATQMTAIFILILGEELTGFKYVIEMGNVAFWVSSLLTIITGYAYVKTALKYTL